MALNWPWAALYASGHKELRNAGDTITSTFSRGVAVPVLCTSSVLPTVPCLLGINYVLELPRKMLSPSFFIFFCIPSENRVVLQFQGPVLRTAVLWLGRAKARKCCKVLTKQNLANCRSQHARVRKWLCVGNTTTTYILTCPCKFCFQQKYHLKFYPKFMRSMKIYGINFMYVFLGELPLSNFFRKCLLRLQIHLVTLYHKTATRIKNHHQFEGKGNMLSALSVKHEQCPLNLYCRDIFR